ncbi:hypothetical protein BD324DRAFT_206135 [Kockovaella imperatae]|uniref:Phytocyanin domain-containing protein n=1 Tax=Kockovaella imperatae TaxID=4999 RepID=A0A1Y1U8N0_9TREE|nr:hypothetical protein BD324DRAFT_206135 [Kockovaella imperatae]ORX33856.1 hypothetical protein BD324DRAFT_206135 [Kockovaella imperatae]
MRASTFLTILSSLTASLAVPQSRNSQPRHVRKVSIRQDHVHTEPIVIVPRTYGDAAAGYEGSMPPAMGMAEGACGDQGCGGEMAAPPSMTYEAAPAMEKTMMESAPPPVETTMMHEAASPPPPMETMQAMDKMVTEISDMNSCMQMCQAHFGGGMNEPMGMGETGSGQVMVNESAPTATEAPAAGMTHTIIVAPTKGVLRFVPFAVTAQKGDMLHFIWGAGPVSAQSNNRTHLTRFVDQHSSTLSLGTNVCNKSTTTDAFDSGKLNASATFDTMFTGDTSSPQFHYCTVGKHCASGVFGVVNPPTTNVTNDLTNMATATLTETAPAPGGTAGSGSAGCQGNSMDCWIERWMQGSPEAQATGTAVKEACSSQPAAWSWGGNFDMSTVESESLPRKTIIENVMYTRLMMSMNPSMLQPGVMTSDNFTAPPDLNSFVAQATGVNSTVSTSASPAGSSVSSSISGSAPSSTDSAAAAQADAAKASGEAYPRVSLVSSAMFGLVGLIAAWLA